MDIFKRYRSILPFLVLLIAVRIVLYALARPHWQDLVTPDTRQHLEVVYGLDRHARFAYSDSNKPYGPMDCSLRVNPLYPLFLTGILKSGNILLGGRPDSSSADWPGKARLENWSTITGQVRRVGFTTIHYDIIIFTQILFSILIGILVFYLADRYISLLAAKAALIFYIFNPPSSIFTVYVNTETMFTLLFTAGIAVLFHSFDEEGRKGILYSIAAGLLTGIASLCRTIALYFAAIVLLVMLLRGYRGYPLLKRYLSWNLGFLPLILLWILRNFLAVGAPVFETISSRNILLYRAGGVLSEVNGLSWEENGARLYGILGERIGDRDLNPAEYAAEEKRLGMEIIRKYPLQAVKTTLLSFIRLMISPGRSEMGQVLGYYPTMLIEHNEVIHFYRYLNFTNLKKAVAGLKESMIWVIFLSWSYLSVLYISGIAGFAVMLRKNIFMSLSLMITVAYFAALSSGPESVSRFRVPFVPFLCIFAGTGISLIIEYARKRS